MVGSLHKWLGHGISGWVAASVIAQAVGSQHKWLGHCISGWVTAYVVGSLQKWLGHRISAWVTASVIMQAVGSPRTRERTLRTASPSRASGSLANQV